MEDYIGYVPRKCSFTNQLIVTTDRASVQISIKKKGLKNNEEIFTLVICGNLRKKGKSDEMINKLMERTE